ncbi:MAG: hypothetical protein ACRDUA_02010, partial [Micromonosporaceae bacterium]
MGRNHGQRGWSRRHVLRPGTASVMGAAGLSVLWERPETTGRNAPLAATRGPASRITPLRTDWRFGGRYTGSDAVLPDFDDSRYATVALPHTVAELSWRDWEPESWEDVWIYRRHFDLPGGYAGSRVFLDFAGVLTAATPWL